MTPDQFSALSQLLRLRPGPAQEAVRMHFVDGVSIAEAAQATGIAYKLAWMAVRRAQAGLDLARRVAS